MGRWSGTLEWVSSGRKAAVGDLDHSHGITLETLKSNLFDESKGKAVGWERRSSLSEDP